MVTNVIVVLILCFYLLIWKKVKELNLEMRRVKNITDLLLIVFMYFFLSYTWLEKGEKGSLIFPICMGLAIFSHLFTFCYPFFFKNAQSDGTARLMITEIFYVWIIFAFINLGMYAVNVNSFSIAESETWAEKAFEFIYYVFCNAVTYGACGIIPVNVPAKIVQILNISIFYFVILNWFVGWISTKIKYGES